MRNKENYCFTLIELLAVIMILGIIDLIAVPVVNNVLNDAKARKDKITANNILKSADLFLASSKSKDVSGNIFFFDFTTE